MNLEDFVQTERDGPWLFPRRNVEGTQGGGPNAGAKAMYELAIMKDPPLRIVIGTDTYKAMVGKIEFHGENYKKFEDISRSTNVMQGKTCTYICTSMEIEAPIGSQGMTVIRVDNQYPRPPNQAPKKYQLRDPPNTAHSSDE